MTDDSKRPELAHGGIASVEGDIATLGSGAQWWLNGSQWARDEAALLVIRDRERVAGFRQMMRS